MFDAWELPPTSPSAAAAQAAAQRINQIASGAADGSSIGEGADDDGDEVLSFGEQERGPAGVSAAASLGWLSVPSARACACASVLRMRLCARQRSAADQRWLCRAGGQQRRPEAAAASAR